MRILKALLPDCALQLENGALGAYLKLKALASQMTVKGVMINGCVLKLEDMAERAQLGFGWEEDVEQLIKAGLLEMHYGVWFFSESRTLFPGTNYGTDAIMQVADVMKQSVKTDDITAVLQLIGGAGEFKRERTDEELRETLKGLYEKFGDLRGVVISYMSMFRTKIQVEKNLRMDTTKHLRLVREVLGMFEAHQFSFKGESYTFTDEMFHRAIDISVQRKLTALRNHNYLKVVLSNQTPGVPKGKERRGTDEGY